MSVVCFFVLILRYALLSAVHNGLTNVRFDKVELFKRHQAGSKDFAADFSIMLAQKQN